jgi:3-oxoacyl-[acyl-carrier-protein] synthase II
MKRVAVTGMGIIDTLGANPKECFDSMLDTNYSHPPLFKHSRLERHRQQPVFPVDRNKLLIPELKPTVLKNLEPCNLFALHTIEQALEQSGVKHSENVGVIGSSITMGNYVAMDTWPPILSETGRVRPKLLLNTPKDYMSGFICQHYGYKGLNTSIYASCATSLFSIDYAMRYVDEYDYVVCVISEHGVNEADISFFKQLGAIGTKSCPFDDNRDGFIMGEGAGAFILESEEKAKKRNANIIAYLYTPGFATDTSSPTSPDPDGKGARLSMRNALKDNDVSFVNAHGTSTPMGDEIEYNAIKEVLGNVPIVSNKSKIGHTGGACGIIEAIYTIKSLQSGQIPDNHNISKCSFDIDGMITDKNRTTTGKMALNNSFGFGGKCASQLIEIV